jgi:molecular chaperone DnaJ
MAMNYYVILGVSPDATDCQIKSAYRERVKEFHPDYYGKNTGPFLAIQEAYSVLSDPARRRNYDHSLNKTAERVTRYDRPEAEPLIPERNQAVTGLHILRSIETYSPSFDQLFDRLCRNFDDVEIPKSENVKSLNIEIPISAWQAAQGGTFRIQVPAHITCPVCRGYSGVGPYGCWRCSERGVLIQCIPVSIFIPSGIPDGYRIEIPLNQFGIHNFYLTAIFRVTNG